MTFTEPKVHFRAFWDMRGPVTPCGWRIARTQQEKEDLRAEKIPLWSAKTPKRILMESQTTKEPREVTCMNCRNILTLIGYNLREYSDDR